MFSGQGTTAPLRKAAIVRILAVSGMFRFPIIIDVPTIAESGFEATSWVRAWYPARTPTDEMEMLSAAAEKAVCSDEVRETLANVVFFPFWDKLQ